MQLAQLIERSAFVRSRRIGSSTVDQDSHAEPKISAGAAELVENWPRPSASIEWSVWNAAMGWMVDTSEILVDAYLHAVYRIAHPGRLPPSTVYRLPPSTG